MVQKSRQLNTPKDRQKAGGGLLDLTQGDHQRADLFAQAATRSKTLLEVMDRANTRFVRGALGGFYPEITDGLERAENFWSCLMTLRRILGLWRRSIYSNTSALAASSVGYFVR